MGKRFGRNQKRALRDAATRADRQADFWREKHQEDVSLLNVRIEEAMRREEAAKRARDTIRITVDALRDEGEGDISIVARFEMARRENLYSALNIDRREIEGRGRTEREAFMRHASNVIAEHALAQILRHWRSR